VLTLDETPTETSLGSSREAVLVLLAVLVGGVLLERRTLGRRLEVLEADLALDALCENVLLHYALVYCLAWNMERLCLFLPEEERRRARSVCRRKKTYRFELRFCDAAGIFGVALALRGCFCSVAHDCDVVSVWEVVECGDGVWRFICCC
jgi:hypothetical protein